jgi:hypothetical protein
VSILVSVVVFLVLAGTGVATASWTANRALTIPASAGSLSFSQSGATAMAAVTYKRSASAAAAVITVTNTGTVPSAFKFAVTAVSTTGLAVNSAGWLVASIADCATTPQHGEPEVTSTSPATGIVLSGPTLAPQNVAYLCIVTSIVPGTASNGATANLTLALTAQQWNWLFAQSTSITQSANGSA